MPDEVVDAQSEVCAARQVEQFTGLAVEPDDLVLWIQHDDAVGHRGGGTTQLAEQARQSLLVESFAAMQPNHLRDDVSPQAHGVRRVGDAAMLEPEPQLPQLPEIPREIERERPADADPHRAGKPTDQRSQPQCREHPQQHVEEGRGARAHVRGGGTKSDSPSRARSGSGGHSRILPAPCAAAGCGRRSCALPRTRCRPRPGRAAARAYTRARDAS